MPAPWPVTPAELAAQHCEFTVDRIPGRPDVTEFKKRARWQQAWWRQVNSLPIGAHRSGRPATLKPNGSKIEESAAREAGGNFLSPAIRSAVEERLAHPQQGQTLDEQRLRTDLLSSMPLCFNLFGELEESSDRFVTAIDRLWPEHPGRPTEMVFEWSPGRQDPRYLGNKSAFDVAFLLDLGSQKRGVIGVETKYHEDIKRTDRPNPRTRLPRYQAVTETAGIFRDGWEAAVVGTDLQQLWLDHLLVLAMLQHPEDRWAWGRFVVVSPTANPSVRDAADRYRDLLHDPETFQFATIEELLDSHVLHTSATEAAFRERYLW